MSKDFDRFIGTVIALDNRTATLKVVRTRGFNSPNMGFRSHTLSLCELARQKDVQMARQEVCTGERLYVPGKGLEATVNVRSKRVVTVKEKLANITLVCI